MSKKEKKNIQDYENYFISYSDSCICFLFSSEQNCACARVCVCACVCFTSSLSPLLHRSASVAPTHLQRKVRNKMSLYCAWNLFPHHLFLIDHHCLYSGNVLYNEEILLVHENYSCVNFIRLSFPFFILKTSCTKGKKRKNNLIWASKLFLFYFSSSSHFLYSENLLYI